MNEQLTFNAIFSNGHFERETLGALINKGGAAGKIYACINHPELVAKIFHDKNKSKTYRQKLEAMLQNKPNIPNIKRNGKTFVQIAWPEAVLEDDEGFCVGYLMPFINTEDAVSLDHLMQKAVRRKQHLTEKYEDRLQAAFNVTAMVAALHQCGHYIIDLKPTNVSVYKENMLVAMFDCDGFSIQGEKIRYPAEYVSEEYIYPEGKNQNPEDMGENQDLFALAVMIFKLLNNGIHPFSGSPRKKDSEMPDIQQRIDQNHYAYGMWPDPYQGPHPDSIHEYFDRKTLDMFDCAFMKDKKRPTAEEWYHHLEDLLKNIKQCKKNPNHVYFTNKGCGLCAVEERVKIRLSQIQKEKKEPQTIRGIKIEELTTEKTAALKKEQKRTQSRLKKLAWFFILLYILVWTAAPVFLNHIKTYLTSNGIFAQILVWGLLLKGLFVLLDKISPKMPLLNNTLFSNMLKIYALLISVLSFIIINDITLESFSLL